MIPTPFVVLDEFPLTPNRKIDRNALPEAGRGDRGSGRGGGAADGRRKRVVAEIWAEVLEVRVVGVDDDFFELGGHSLLATRLVAAVCGSGWVSSWGCGQSSRRRRWPGWRR